jgi:hypothetical protein
LTVSNQDSTFETFNYAIQDKGVAISSVLGDPLSERQYSNIQHWLHQSPIATMSKGWNRLKRMPNLMTMQMMSSMCSAVTRVILRVEMLRFLRCN